MKWDPTEYYPSVPLTDVLYWPDDDCLQSKHVAIV